VTIFFQSKVNGRKLSIFNLRFRYFLFYSFKKSIIMLLLADAKFREF